MSGGSRPRASALEMDARSDPCGELPAEDSSDGESGRSNEAASKPNKLIGMDGQAMVDLILSF